MLSLIALASAQAATHSVTAELIPDTTAIQPGHPFTVGLYLHVPPDMHVYWSNPGDGGGPIRITWNLPAGFTAGPLQYPVPNRIPQPGNLLIYGYEDQVLLQTQITPPARLKSKTVHLTALGQWVVCSTVQCYFGKGSLSADLPVASPQPANTALFAAWAPRMPRSPADAFSAVDVDWNAAADKATLTFHWKNPSAVPENIHWLPGPDDATDVHEEDIFRNANTTTLILSIQPVTGIPQKQTAISGVLSYHKDDQPPQGVAVTFDRKTTRLTDAAAH